MYSFQKCKRVFFVCLFCPSWFPVGWSLPSEFQRQPTTAGTVTRDLEHHHLPLDNSRKSLVPGYSVCHRKATLKKCRLIVKFRALERQRDGSQVSFCSISRFKCHVPLFQTIQCVGDLGYACSNSLDIGFRQGLERLAFHRNRSLATNCKCRSDLTRAI